jgi:hypothetical protein
MKQFFLWSIPVLALCALAAVYLWRLEKSEQAEPQTVSNRAPTAEPAVRYPVATDEQSAPLLPPLAESDSAIIDGLVALFAQTPPEILHLKDIVHRLVATVDNLPRDYVAPQLMPVRTATGLPIMDNIGGNLVLSPRNAARYQTYVQLAHAVPTDALVALYARFYPLFQEEYEKLGFPGKHFNDRAVAVIDHLLATPEVPEPLVLTQPGVLYEFADPKLNTLSAGQKILLRIGKANRDKLKSKLQELRQALTLMATKE